MKWNVLSQEILPNLATIQRNEGAADDRTIEGIKDNIVLVSKNIEMENNALGFVT